MRLLQRLLPLCLAAFALAAAAQNVQQTVNQLRAQSAAGTLDAQRDVAPVLDRVRAGGNEREIGPLLRALAEVVEDGRAPLAVRESLRAELPALILAFARGPHSAMERDTVLLTLRDVEASEADTRAGIGIANAESDKGFSYFTSTAQLLTEYLQSRQPPPTRTVVARVETAAPPKTGPTPAPGARPTPSSSNPQSDATIEAQFDTMMRAAQQALNDRRYPAVLSLVVGFEDKLRRHDPKYGEQTMWAYLLDFKRYSQFETRDKAGSRATCRRAVDVLSADGPATKDGNVVRGTVRACHNMLAWDRQAGARNEGEIGDAIRHINACFASVAANEPPSVLDDFYETRATVFLKANRLTNDAYRRQLFETLSEAQARKVDLSGSPELAKAMKSREYQDYRKGGGARKAS